MDPDDIFEKQGRIGRGSFGEVYKGVRKQNGEVSYANPAIFYIYVRVAMLFFLFADRSYQND